MTGMTWKAGGVWPPSRPRRTSPFWALWKGVFCVGGPGSNDTMPRGRGLALSLKIHLCSIRRNCAFQSEFTGHFRMEGTAAFRAVSAPHREAFLAQSVVFL